MAPLIGISCRISHDYPDAPPLHGVRASYLDSIVAAGGLPIVIPLLEDEASLRSLYGLCSGLLFPGGEDVEPAHYQEEPHPKLGKVAPERDRVELQLMSWARQDRKPVLGICRGAQLMNVAYGGSLYQDIDAQRPGEAPHGRSGWDEMLHVLRLVAGSRLHQVLGVDTIGANSLHHQAIKRVGSGLRATGYSDDKIVEAIEGADPHFVIGVQCHPEALWQSAEPRWQKLFVNFVRAADDFSSAACGG